MECNFGVGDKVFCIDARPSLPGDFCILQEGFVYTIKALLPPRLGIVGVQLIETPALYSIAYQATRFRKVTDTTATVAALAQAMHAAMKKGMVDA